MRTVVLGAVGTGWTGCQSASTEVRRAERCDANLAIEKAKGYGLISVVAVDSTILIDQRYARPGNVFGGALYPANMPCLLAARTAVRLAKAQSFLRRNGYGLRVWDAWRPPEAHRKLWERKSLGDYVSNPKNGWSRHCYGRAVDVTLVDKNGQSCLMPTEFDDFSPRAAWNAEVSEPKALEHRDWLQRAMVFGGFHLLESEWWHFNDAENDEKMVGPPVFARDLGIVLP